MLKITIVIEDLAEGVDVKMTTAKVGEITKEEGEVCWMFKSAFEQVAANNGGRDAAGAN